MSGYTDSNEKYNNILQINYSDKSKLKQYVTNSYKDKFNWKQYVKYYKDLEINNLNDAWDHWVRYGLLEKRLFFINDEKKTSDKSLKKKISGKKHTSTPINVKVDGIKLSNNVKFVKNNNDEQLDKPSKHIKSLQKEVSYTNESIVKSILSKFGNENTNFKIRLLRKNNLVYKNIYDNYGLHYYGWREVINNFIKKFEKNTSFKQQYFFDEWIEKFLVWGDKMEKNFYLKEILTNSYQIITFSHNPPYQKWYQENYNNYIRNKIIYNDQHTNKTLITNIEASYLYDKITYFYTLSNYHKEYIYNKCPKLRNKLLSINHPIEINENEKIFDFSSFCQNKQIVHIGWWLRNFKTFIDFKQPEDFHKTILVKNDFETEWNTLSLSYKLDNITIIKELSNTEYEKIFVNSCIFLDLEDTSANNTILECIKFNTPLIVRKIPSVVEYLGENYPLYFETNEELNLFNNPNHLLSLIQATNDYFINMDKTHVMLDTFNKKVSYDLNKLDSNETNSLTWFCLINDLENIENKFSKLYNNFVSQNDNSKIKLNIIIDEKLSNSEMYDRFVDKIQKYSEIVHNISFSIKLFEKGYSDFLIYCSEICETQYLVIIDINDELESNYSSTFINYLNENPNCDVTFSSYKITNGNDYNESFIFSKNSMLFQSNFSNSLIPETGVVWRKDMYDLIGKFLPLGSRKFIFREYWIRVLKKKFNMTCCSSEITYKCSIY
jgi:hypothetical protein